MSKFRLFQNSIVVLGIMSIGPLGHAAEQQAFVQKDILAATIIATENRYVVDVTALASDFEEMFQGAMAERRGVDLSGPGILELEIGRFVARRIAIRDREGNPCPSKIERAGEDPANDEGVLVSLTFECKTKDVVYDASKFIAARGPRAWQVVTIVRGGERRQVMLNSESPPTPIDLQPASR